MSEVGVHLSPTATRTTISSYGSPKAGAVHNCARWSTGKLTWWTYATQSALVSVKGLLEDRDCWLAFPITTLGGAATLIGQLLIVAVV